MPLTLYGPFVFPSVQRKNHSKGYHQMVHRTDEGFAVGQHGGEDLDKIVVSFTLFGSLKEIAKQILEYLANTGVPRVFISTLVSFRNVRVLSFDFSENSGKTNIITGTLTLQRVKIASRDLLLVGAFIAARLVGRYVFSPDGPVNMLLRDVETSIASPYLRPVSVYTYTSLDVRTG